MKFAKLLLCNGILGYYVVTPIACFKGLLTKRKRYSTYIVELMPIAIA